MMKNNTLEQTRISYKGNEALFKNTQGNILKSHGRDHLAIIALTFKKDHLKDVKAFISHLDVTSAEKQIEQTKAYKKPVPKKGVEPANGQPFISFHLSYAGYQVLGVPTNNIPTDEAFVKGMDTRKLGDPARSSWESPYNDTNIHALLQIAADDKSNIKELIENLTKKWAKAIKLIHIQYGEKLTNDGIVIEHFGYRDGVSQPLFLEDDFINDNQPIHTQKWNPEAQLGLVLTPDPGVTIKDCYGSYLVYRKLEQNVKAFKEAEEELAHQLGFEGGTEEVAGALMVGRFENGLPVVKFGSTTSPEEPSAENDFTYDLDPDGKRCPFHSHIRKTNPRGDSKRSFGISDEEERQHRIARRGITYDEYGRNGNLEIEPEGKVGLLFMCFQSNISNQFEFIQRSWANNNDFPQAFSGIDPVIGQGQNRVDTDHNAAEQKWPDIKGNQQCRSLSGFVTMLGGGYFFTPSIPFLKSFNQQS